MIADAFGLFTERVRPRPESVASDTEAAERSLLEFARQSWSMIRPGDPWVDGWVFGCLCEHYQAVFEGQIKKLAVACPPRHGKSIVGGVFFPTWVWTKAASKRFIYAGYSAHLAKRDSISCRDLIQSAWYQARWGHLFKFKEGQNTQAQFTNDRGGFRIATTPGGWATGEGADIVSADDLTSVEDAFSPAALEHAWRFWTQTMTMRFHDPEKIARIMSMQRTAKGDLIGRAIAEDMGYEVLTLPFEAEPRRIWFTPAQRSELHLPESDEPKPDNAIIPTSLQIARPHLRDQRDEGAILWPERFKTQETIDDLRKSVKAGAPGQLQQRPAGELGAIFKPSKYRLFYPKIDTTGDVPALAFVMGDGPMAQTVRADECLWYQTIDTAMKIEQSNDYTAILTVFKTPHGQLGVFHVFREKLLIPEQWPAIQELRIGQGHWDSHRRQWSLPAPLRPWPRALSFQAVEPKSSGVGLLQTARLAGTPLKELTDSDTNKILRASTAVNMLESGLVFFNSEGQWRSDFENELTDFPAGEHDDMVDALSYAAILCLHDSLVKSYSGDMVYNPRVHDYLDAKKKKAEEAGGYVPKGLRDTAPVQRESFDDIMRSLQGAPAVKPVVIDDDGRLDPRLFTEDR